MLSDTQMHGVHCPIEDCSSLDDAHRGGHCLPIRSATGFLVILMTQPPFETGALERPSLPVATDDDVGVARAVRCPEEFDNVAIGDINEKLRLRRLLALLFTFTANWRSHVWVVNRW